LNILQYDDPRLAAEVQQAEIIGICASVEHPHDDVFLTMLEQRAAQPAGKAPFFFSQGGAGDINLANSSDRLRALPITTYASSATNRTVPYATLVGRLQLDPDLVLMMKKFTWLKLVCLPNEQWFVPLTAAQIGPKGAPGPFPGKGAAMQSLQEAASRSGKFPMVNFALPPGEVNRQLMHSVPKEEMVQIMYGPVVQALDKYDTTGGELRCALTAMVVMARALLGIYMDPATPSYDLASAPDIALDAALDSTDSGSMFDLFAVMAGARKMPPGEFAACMAQSAPATSGEREFEELLPK
jgi:hypothetical protein